MKAAAAVAPPLPFEAVEDIRALCTLHREAMFITWNPAPRKFRLFWSGETIPPPHRIVLLVRPE